MEVECSDSDIDRMVISSGNCLIFIQFPNLSIHSNTESREVQVLESDGTQGLESDSVQVPGDILNVVEVEDENIGLRKSRAGSNEFGNDNVDIIQIENVDDNNKDNVHDDNVNYDDNHNEDGGDIVENIDYIVDLLVH